MKTCFGNTVIFLWVMAITFFPLACGEGCSEEQNRALLEIRNSTNGLAFEHWDGRNCCEADQVLCYGRNGGVSSITLDNVTSSTWYPNVTWFTLFEELERLELRDMQIGGGLQPFCELKRLKHLTELSLPSNELEGVIPSCLGMIANLQTLFLEYNRLHGNIPPSIFSKQNKIAWFDVSDNQLDGVLSFSIFANASSLVELDLSRNYDLEVETESPSWVPTFQLRSLGLECCIINKKNGHVIPSFISSQFSMGYLELSNSAIEGSIPCQLFFNTSIRFLFLRSNKIDGFFLDCFANRTSSLVVLDISDNCIKGCLPEYVGHVLPHLRQVNMSSNALEGKIPWSFGNLTLEILDLSYNMLSGTLPQSLTRDGTYLGYLDLSNNKLQGEIFPRNSNMTSLKFLLLGNNHFEGVIAPTISNSLTLEILDVRNNHLSGNIPKWLYDHPSLAVVIFSRNRFEGHLLREICQMGL